MKKLIFTLIFLLAASTASAITIGWDHANPADVYCFQMERSEDNINWRNGKSTCDGTMEQDVNLLPGSNYFRVYAIYWIEAEQRFEYSGYSNILPLPYTPSAVGSDPYALQEQPPAP